MIHMAGNGRLLAAALAVSAIMLAACVGGGSAGGLKGAFDNPAFGERLLYVSGIDGYLYAMDMGLSDLTASPTQSVDTFHRR